MNNLYQPVSGYPEYILYNTWMLKLVEQFSAGALPANDAGAIIFALCQPYRDALKAELIEQRGKFFAAGFIKTSERADPSRIAILITAARARQQTAPPKSSFTYFASELDLINEGEIEKRLDEDR
jgi:hypothetical protein